MEQQTPKAKTRHFPILDLGGGGGEGEGGLRFSIYFVQDFVVLEKN